MAWLLFRERQCSECAVTCRVQKAPFKSMTEAAAKLGLATKLTYGFGAVAYGIKDNGFAYFLLLFYGTVVGLEPALAGTALLIALVFDSLSDPVVGYWSDNTRSRWGRRHPFMYAAAIPVALCYSLLWQPPDWSDGALRQQQAAQRQLSPGLGRA